MYICMYLCIYVCMYSPYTQRKYCRVLRNSRRNLCIGYVCIYVCMYACMYVCTHHILKESTAGCSVTAAEICSFERPFSRKNSIFVRTFESKFKASTPAYPVITCMHVCMYVYVCICMYLYMRTNFRRENLNQNLNLI